MAQIIVLNSAPNQSMRVTLFVNGQSLTLNLFLSYNEVGQFWQLDITDSAGNPKIYKVPLLTGDWPAANILGPYEYMRIGELYVISTNAGLSDYPNNQNLSQWFFLWTDNTTTAVAA